MLRVLAFSILAAVLVIGFGLPARSLVSDEGRAFAYADVDRLVAFRRANDWAAVRDVFSGQAVEILFTPTAAVKAEGGIVLHDTRAGLACAVSPAIAKRVSRPGDDFLVVRGIVRQVQENRIAILEDCEVTGYEGLAWEAEHRSEHERRRGKYRDGLA